MPIGRPSGRSKKEPVKTLGFHECPAKTFIGPTGNPTIGRSVFEHCRIVGEVAKELVIRSGAAQLFPQDAHFAAACHDIGKVSPTFYSKLMRACKQEGLPGINPDLEKAWGGHAGVSQLTAKHVGTPKYVPEVLGQHHGFSPHLSGMKATDEIFGGAGWQVEREKLVAELSSVLNGSWPSVESASQARLLAGLTSVADWIGSGQHFNDPALDWRERISQAVDDAGFVPATFKSGLTFQDVFGFTPREAQSTLIDCASTPGVFVMEAPMGMGKTEAALYAAYQIASDGHATGIYFALPTQLTSNKIFERFQKFLSQVLADDCSHRSLLLHANAWLFDTDMGEEGQPGGAWFNQSKRGLLAPFAVGTVDQALMAAMNVKHGFVRAFGLAGKVVILDEVHTYDTYTGSLLDDLVSLLRDLQCTVIILSATLNQERREQLLGHPTKSMAYPLVTSSPSLSPSDVIETYVPPSDSRSISVHLSNSDASAMNEALARAGEGQQVLWIENTVKDAQQRFLDLASRCAEIGVGCGLLTSRFTVNDRQNIEAEWVTLFGKSGWGKRSEKGRILIGTQVLEQSIDIDADFMVTRFAPTDMVLQRFGRLWRHEGTPRPVEANPDAWLLAPALESAIEEPQKHFGSSAFVYSPFVLCRSLETWQEVKSINLPQDIRGLIESTYETRQESGPMSQWLRDLDDGSRQRLGRNAMRQLARVALAEGGNTLPEEKASTRYSDSESVDVLMLRSISHDTDKGQIRLILDNGDVVQIALYRSGLNRDQWRKRTAVLMRHVVAVPMGQDPKGLSIRQLRNLGLHHCFYLGDPEQPDQEALLRVVLVDETGCLKSITGGDAHENHQLEYRNDLGYRAIKA